MENRPPRVALNPEDLKPFCVGGEKSVYRLYAQIKKKYEIDKEIKVTIFNVRDYFKIGLEEVIWTIFGVR